METSKVISERGKDVLIVQFAKFTRDKVLSSGETYWRCAIRSCKAKVFTIGRNDVISRGDLHHNHPKDIQKLNRQVISNKVKRKATEQILNQRPSDIIHSVLKEHSSEQVSTVSARDVHYIRNNYYNNRRKYQPAQPNTTEDVVDWSRKVNSPTMTGLIMHVPVDSSDTIIATQDSNVMDVKIVQGTRGRLLLIFENYKFRRSSILKTGETYWRCCEKFCKAKVYTAGESTMIVRSSTSHTHEEDDMDKLNRQIISDACKRRGIQNLDEKPSELIRMELNQDLPISISAKDVACIRRNIYNARRKVLNLDTEDALKLDSLTCYDCDANFTDEENLLNHLLHHVKQPSILIQRLQLAPIKLTFKSKSDNQFEIINSPTAENHQTSPEYFANDQMETDVIENDISSFNGGGTGTSSNLDEITEDLIGLEEATVHANFSPAYITEEQVVSNEPSKSVSPKMTSDQFTGDIPGAEPTPPPESPTEYPKIRIKTTGLLKDPLTITEITDDNPDGEYRPSELVDISNSGDNNTDVSNFWSTPCLEDPLKLPENEHNDSILSSFLTNNSDQNKDFGMGGSDNEFISLDRLDDRNRNNALQIYNPRNATVSSNPLNSLTGLPMQQLAEQVSRLQPSGSGMHQQNVLINIQQFPQPPQPPAYQHPPMYPGHPGMPGQPPHMYQPYQYQPPPNPMYFPPAPNYQPGPHMPPPQMPQPNQQMQQPMPPPQPQYRQPMPQRLPTSQQFNQTPQRGPPPRQQIANRPQMAPRQSMGQRPPMLQRHPMGPRQQMAVSKQGIQMRQRAPAPMIRPKTGTMIGNAAIRGPRPRMQNSNMIPNGTQNNLQGAQRMKRPNEQILNQLKKKRMDVLVPDKNDDLDCQVIAMQPKNTDGGLPQITNVQGGTSDAADNVMHLSDSITLSVRNPQPRPSSPKKSDAKQVANILATRGITVTATPKPKEKTMKDDASPASPTATVAINLNNAVSIIPTAKNNTPATSPKPTDARLPTVDLTDDSAPETSHQNSQLKQPQTPPQKNNQQRGSASLPFRCDLCPAQYPTMGGLNKHRQSFHKTASSCEIGIPLIDFKQPGIMQKLTSIGIYNFIPLPNSANGNFALPVISLNAAKNSSLCNLSTLGASSILSLGPVRSLPKNQANNGVSNLKQQPH